MMQAVTHGECKDGIYLMIKAIAAVELLTD